MLAACGLAGLVAAAAPAASASTPVAVMDTAPTSTLSQQVPPGGTISTGPGVSADNPVQLTLTTDTGGTLTINSVVLPAGTYRNALGPDDHTTYFNPRFVIPAGGAHVSAATLLVDGALLPGGMYSPNVPQLVLNIADHYGSSGTGAARADSLKGPDGNLRIPLNVDQLDNDNRLGADVTIDVGRPTFGGLASFYPNTPVLSGFHSARDLLAGRIYSYGACTVFCTDKTTVTLSQADARWLGISNRVLASSPLLGMTAFHVGHLPLTANGRAVLKRAIAKQAAMRTTCVTRRLPNGWLSTTCIRPTIRTLTASARTVVTGTLPGEQIVKTQTLKFRAD